MAPGQSATYALRIRNVGTESGIAHVGDDLHSHYPWMDDFTSYSLVQSDLPGCGTFDREFAGFLNFYRIVFQAGPIASGEYLDCIMTVGRDADSRHDMAMSWGIRTTIEPPEYAHYADAALFGTLTDVSIETRTFGFSIDHAGFAHATTELKVRNRGSMPVNPQTAGACEDNFVRPFATNGSGPGGCGSDQYAPMCFDWGYGFRVPEIAAGATYSCLIRLTSNKPYESPLGFPIGLDFAQSGAGYSFIDFDTGNNQTALRLEPDAIEGAAMAVPTLRQPVLIGLGVAIVLIVLCYARSIDGASASPTIASARLRWTGTADDGQPLAIRQTTGSAPQGTGSRGAPG